jgi:hypothetical protein
MNGSKAVVNSADNPKKIKDKDKETPEEDNKTLSPVVSPTTSPTHVLWKTNKMPRQKHNRRIIYLQRSYNMVKKSENIIRHFLIMLKT